MTTIVRLAVLAGAFALITVAVGWWGVAPVGILWGWLTCGEVRRASLLAGLAAATGWLALLIINAPLEETRNLAAAASGLLSVPAPGVVIATVGIGATLAFLGSWTGSVLRSGRVNRRGTP